MIKAQLTVGIDTTSIDLKNLNIGFYTYILPKRGISGSNGHDPGIRTRMWFDPLKQTGVILFSNTSMSWDDYKTYFLAIYDELWKYTVTLNDN